VIAVFGTVMDITARVTAEASRAEDEARYRAMSERVLLATQAGQIGVWEWNVQTGALAWDDRMYALYGLVPGEALTAERFYGPRAPRRSRRTSRPWRTPPWRAKRLRHRVQGRAPRAARCACPGAGDGRARRGRRADPAGGRQLGRHRRA
jgi:PAS domain-containing protein